MLKHQQTVNCFQVANSQNAAQTQPAPAKGNDSFIKVVITGYETAGYGLFHPAWATF